jgi:hypothetical protein
VDRAVLWTTTVKKGDIPRQIHGLGYVKGSSTSGKRVVLLRIASDLTDEVVPDQKILIDTQKGIVPGRVSDISKCPENGMYTLEVSLDGPLPIGVSVGAKVDGTIDLEAMKDVIYIGRPVHGEANTTISLFKVVKNGAEAIRVQVKLGRASVNTIEVLDGLAVGDEVIISDMSNFDNTDRVILNKK